MKRLSPVQMPLKAETIQIRNDFEVVQTYGKESHGPSLVDLSHLAKWEIETADLDEKMNLIGLSVPVEPNSAFLSDKRVVSRLTPTRALVWDFGIDEKIDWESTEAFNDFTDGSALFFMTGEGLLSIMERLTEMDLKPKNASDLLFLQGSVIGVPAKILISVNREHQLSMFISVARGFGQSVANAILSAGGDADISPAGEHVFLRWSEK